MESIDNATRDEVTENQVSANEAATKRRWPWIGISAVVVAAFLLAGALAFTMAADHDRSSAVGDRAHAQQLLRSQRIATEQYDEQLATAVTELEDFSRAVGTPLSTEQNIVTLEDQGLTAEQAVQSAGVSGTVDDYNNAIDQANAAVDQYNAALATLNQQLKALPYLPAGPPPKSV
jgi:hypothetical protein